jgi:hypothetical protein
VTGFAWLAAALATSGAAAIRVHDHLSGRAFLSDGIDRFRLGRRSLAEWARSAQASPQRAPVVACLTTTPTRMPYLATTLASLFAQTRPPERIELHVPAWSRREGRTYAVPQELLALEGLTIVPCEDLGPATKLLPALARHAPNRAILVIDDDVILPPGFVHALAEWAARMPDAVVAASGWIVPSDLTDRPTTLFSNLFARPPTPLPGTRLRRPRRVDVVQGCGGYVVRPRFFDARVFDYEGAPAEARWVDDVWISAHANAEKWVVPIARYAFRPYAHRALFDASALGRINRGPGAPERRANTIVIRHFADRWDRRSLGADVRR